MKAPSLTTQIFVGLLAGIVVGWLFPHFGTALEPGADIFLRLIKTIVAPLVFAMLVSGIAGGGSLHAVGRLAVKCLIYFEVITTLALLVGLAVVNILQPGLGVSLSAADAGGLNLASVSQPSLADIVTHCVPTSVIDAMARGDVLQIVVFSVFFAAAVSATKADIIVRFCDSLGKVMFKYTDLIMRFAPVGVFCAMASTIGEHGLSVLWSLGKLVGTLYLALVVFISAVLLPVALCARVPIGRFFKAVREPFLIAFSTASSEAALPRALETMESFGVPKSIISFVLPLGYSFNLDGTTLYLSVTALFVAQAAGAHLSLSQQLLMMLTLMLTSKGVAAVPRASLVILSGALASFNLPLAGVALILGVDTLMDMARTSVNVLGNCLAAAVLAKWEGKFGAVDGQCQASGGEQSSKSTAEAAEAGGRLDHGAGPIVQSSQLQLEDRASL